MNNFNKEHRLKPRIIAFTNLYPRPWEAGRAAFNRQQFEYLTKYFDIEVLVPVAWTDHLAKWWKNNISDSYSNDKIRVKYFCYFFPPGIARWSYGLCMMISALGCIPRLLGKNRPQSLFATWAYPDAMAAMMLGKIVRIPVVVKVHGTDINKNPSLPGVRPQIAWTLRNAAAVVAVSRDLADKVIQLGAAEQYTRVIYNGVDFNLFHPKDKRDCRKNLSLEMRETIVLFVGNLKPAKGCLDLLEGFSRLLKQHPDAKLVYIGSGTGANQISKRSATLGISRNVKLLGAISHRMLPEWMGAADVVALPSHNEGVPNVLLEAMACGRPVVASAVGGIPEIVPAFAGFLVPKGDSAALTDTLDKALTKKWDVTKISVYAGQFSWERNVSELKNLCDGVK